MRNVTQSLHGGKTAPSTMLLEGEKKKIKIMKKNNCKNLPFEKCSERNINVPAIMSWYNEIDKTIFFLDNGRKLVKNQLKHMLEGKPEYPTFQVRRKAIPFMEQIKWTKTNEGIVNRSRNGFHPGRNYKYYVRQDQITVYMNRKWSIIVGKIDSLEILI